MWDEITSAFPFPEFSDCTVEVLEVISYHILWFYWTYDYISMLLFKFKTVSKRGLSVC